MAKSGSRPWSLVITCEHAGAKVPPAFRRQMTERQQKDLATHKGWDAGALAIAQYVARSLKAPLHFTQISRLFVDSNRSPHHPRCLGPAFRACDPEQKNFILAAYYWPHRNAIEKTIREQLAAGHRVLHLAMHSFTPVLDGEVRSAEVGLLYDPQRPAEKVWAQALLDEMQEVWPAWRLRRNYPYLGKADGLTTWLRKHYGPKVYAGIEVEWNQSVLQGSQPSMSLKRGMTRCLQNLLDSGPG